mmetsp:Transcript_37280/g.57182  ORF Transcript_37280/g.57182 Transcript_37280/m.57182 type:complete len:142 (+) Transcript_37280:3332-3757(+)
MPDLTCTSQQFLDLGAGDSEEHAILLCNYFNFIDRAQGRQKRNENDDRSKDFHSFIVFGEAVPQGQCWFVCRADKQQQYKHFELWNPMTGECYNFDKTDESLKRLVGQDEAHSMNQRNEDPRCPMKRVWCIVGQENVWANI